MKKPKPTGKLWRKRKRRTRLGTRWVVETGEWETDRSNGYGESISDKFYVDYCWEFNTEAEAQAFLERRQPKKEKPMFIKSAYVVAAGDPSVGIGGSSALVQADGDWLLDLSCLAEEDQPKAVEEFKRDLESAFTKLWGEPATATVEVTGE